MLKSGLWLIAILGVVVGACSPQEREPAAADPAERGYDPDTLAWFQEGRPVDYERQQWRPIGEAVFERRGTLERVGEFEGMALYAPVDESPPYDHLFFPYGNETWQPLEPIPPEEAEPAADS